MNTKLFNHRTLAIPTAIIVLFTLSLFQEKIPQQLNYEQQEVQSSIRR